MQYWLVENAACPLWVRVGLRSMTLQIMAGELRSWGLVQHAVFSARWNASQESLWRYPLDLMAPRFRMPARQLGCSSPGHPSWCYWQWLVGRSPCSWSLLQCQAFREAVSCSALSQEQL